MTTRYSTAQKLALAGMVIGSLLCAIGGCAPYWLVFDPDGFGVFDLVKNVVSANMGPFMYCQEVFGVSACYGIGFDVTVRWLTAVRIGTGVCILVSGFCGLISLCLACCTCCERLIALGILAVLAAAAGIFSAVMFNQNTDIFTTSILGFQLTSYGWAFYVFCAGVGVVGLVSFMACFSAPENVNAVHGMVMTQPVSHIIVQPSAPALPIAPPHPHMTPQQWATPKSSVEPGVTVIDTTGY